MNATNVTNSITTTVTNLVGTADIAASPLAKAQLVSQIVSLIQAAEVEAVQRAADVAKANAIALRKPS